MYLCFLCLSAAVGVAIAGIKRGLLLKRVLSAVGSLDWFTCGSKPTCGNVECFSKFFKKHFTSGCFCELLFYFF